MKCIIVDDEPIARRGMQRLAERHNDIEICNVFASAEEAVNFIADTAPDLIFLDIQMPGLSGIELARRLPDNVMVIFTTAYSEYALESYDLNAIDYLVKPIDPERFDRAVEKARIYSRLQASEVNDTDNTDTCVVAPEHLIVKSDRRFVRLRFSDIKFIEGLKDYVVVNLTDRKIITRITIKGIEALLPADKFIRVNKSYIVNTDYIEAFDSNDVVIGTLEIAIGQTYKEKVMGRLLP